MSTNLDRFKNDLDELVLKGDRLYFAMKHECFPEETREELNQKLGGDAEAFVKKLPNFRSEYQDWYSESLALLKQLLPDRLGDFVRHYERPKGRKEITCATYQIEDYLHGVTVGKSASERGFVGLDVAIPHFMQQLAIVRSTKGRFKSSLFEIRQLVQADLLDNELDAAEVLLKHQFTRAAGAVAGVVLERHLGQVCADRSIAVDKKHPTIGDFNEALKAAGAIDVPQWRFNQHLADIRNLCDHSRKPDPTDAQVADLLAGVKKVIKSIF